MLDTTDLQAHESKKLGRGDDDFKRRLEYFNFSTKEYVLGKCVE
jgi:hypothetical protein